MNSKSFKDKKLITIVKEIDVIPNVSRYNINGIDLEKVIYFWRSSQGMFEPIPLGSYTIRNEGIDTFLVITDTEGLSDKERLQIGYEFASISSKYEVEFNVDINILKDKYNKLVQDVKTIFKHIQINMMTADSLDVDVVLPQLDTDEVWVKTETGWRGLNIGNLEANIQNLIDEFKEMSDQVFADLEADKDKYVAELEAVKNGQEAILDNYLNQNLDRVKAEGDLQVSRVTLTGTEQDNKVTNTGNFQYERLSDLIAQTGIDTKLILINQMFDVIIGSNRYLNGQSLELRDILYLDRQPDGQSLSTRKDLRSSYDGGLLSIRTVTIN